MKLKRQQLMQMAMPHPGMFGELLSAGRLTPDMRSLEISREDFDQITSRYSTGLGTALHTILKPVVAVADRVLKTNLTECGGCAMRELKLNRL